eukprot:TRINITY_DN2536_c0_g1_i2.p1 TRINITY_DN2536_c0_g1~~TRINITY_DN2536_c0_g1_i2.p1  ORF type:complete len:439 (-),score=135.79 TRINITY_DN2536_c0_g1_i2:1353-2594(-)
MTPAQFAGWARDVAERGWEDPVFRKRVAIRALLEETGASGFEAALDAAKAAYAACAQRPAIAAVEEAALSADKAAALAQKRANATAKLAEADAQLRAAKDTEDQLRGECAEYGKMAKAQAELDALYDSTGITAEMEKLRKLKVQHGHHTRQAGIDTEQQSYTTADVEPARAAAAEAPRDDVASVLQAHLKQPCERPVALLRNVSLGMHSAELDLVLVQRGETPTSPVEVLAVAEVKHNISDVGEAFSHYQKTLAWLTGDKSKYDPANYKNKFYRQGHFTKATHKDTAMHESFVFALGSFRRFCADRDGYFMEGLYFCTKEGTPQPLHSGALAILQSRLAGHTDIPRRDVAPAVAEAQLLELHAWALAILRGGGSVLTTYQVLALYLRHGLADHIVFLPHEGHDVDSDSATNKS